MKKKLWQQEGPKNVTTTGGIDVRNIDVDRQGDLMANVVGDAAMEQLLWNAPGVRAVILNVTPIADVRPLLGLK